MRVILLILLFLFSPLVEAKTRVEFKVSKMLGLQDFVFALLHHPHTSEILRSTFEKSSFNTPESAGALKKLSDLSPSLYVGWSFHESSTEDRQSQNIRSAMIISAAHSKDIDDFQQRALAFLPPTIASEYFSELRKFEKAYETLIWNPNHVKLQAYLKNMKALTTQHSRMDQIFESVSTFYGTKWPNNIPFEVVFYPLPGSEGDSSAESIFSVESVAVLVDETKYAMRFGIIVHEMAHSIYAAQSVSLQKEIRSFFEQSSSPHAELAYTYLNEGLATALGNGWAHEHAFGKFNSGSWYNDQHIDSYAHGLFPLVKKYVENKKSIDKNFVNAAINIFENLFPDANLKFDTLLNSIDVVSYDNSLTGYGFAVAAGKYFQVSSVNGFSPITAENISKALSNVRKQLIVIIAEDKDLATLKNVPVLEPFLERISSQGAEIVAGFVQNNPCGDGDKEHFSSADTCAANRSNQPLLIIRLKAASDLERAFELLKKKQKIPMKLEQWSL